MTLLGARIGRASSERDMAAPGTWGDVVASRAARSWSFGAGTAAPSG